MSLITMNGGRMRAARRHTTVALAFLLISGAVFAALDVVARNQRLARWVDTQQDERRRESCESYSHFGLFMDFGDQLLLEELEKADYSEGGVYLFGDSKVRHATRLWERPPYEQRMIHNYAIGNTCHQMQFDFIRFLVEQRGLLRGGEQSTLVILGVSYSNASCRFDDKYFAELWERHGLYSCSESKGIQTVPMSALRRRLRIERGRIIGLSYAIERLAVLFVGDLAHAPALRKHDSKSYNANRREYMGADWESNMAEQLAVFGRMADYLVERGVQIAVVLMPMGSWEHNLPFNDRYIAEMTSLCRERDLELYDWTWALEDDEFGDQSHSNSAGSRKLTHWFLEIALTHVHSHSASDVSPAPSEN